MERLVKHCQQPPVSCDLSTYIMNASRTMAKFNIVIYKSYMVLIVFSFVLKIFYLYNKGLGRTIMSFKPSLWS